MTTDIGCSPSGPGQSGLRPEPASRLGHSATVPNAWRAGELTVNTDNGPVVLPAWLHEYFALDFRVWDLSHPMAYEAEYVTGWQLTHIPTGLRVCALILSIDKAKAAVEQLAASFDWDFSDPAHAIGKSHLLKPLKDDLGDKIIFRDQVLSPLGISVPASAGETQRAETTEIGSVGDDHATGAAGDVQSPDAQPSSGDPA